MALQQRFEYAKRPAPGTLGKPIRVTANLFDVSPSRQYGRGQLPPWFQYQVAFSKVQTGEGAPGTISKALKSALWKKMSDEASKNSSHALYSIAMAWDGMAIAYSTDKMDELVLKVYYSRRDVRPDEKPTDESNAFEIKLTHVATVDANDAWMHTRIRNREQADLVARQTALTALNVILLHTARVRFDATARAFYLATAPGQSLRPEDFRLNVGECIELWRGFHHSVRPIAAGGGAALNMNATSGAYIAPCSLLDFICSIAGVSSSNFRCATGNQQGTLSGQQLTIINRFLRSPANKVHLTYEVPGTNIHRSKTRVKADARGVSSRGVGDITFALKGSGQQTSVLAYYRQTYNVNLRPNWPAIEVTKGTFLPVQLCSIPEGIPYARKLNPNQQVAATAFQQLKPAERFAMIERMNATVLEQKRGPFARNFGIEVSTKPKVVPAHILPSHGIVYQNPRDAKPIVNGQWRMNLGKDKFQKLGGELKNYAVFEVTSAGRQPQRRHVDSIAQLLATMERVTGLRCAGARCVHHGALPEGAQESQLVNYLKQAGTKGASVCFIIVRKQSTAYDHVKSAGDLAGVTTQCLTDFNVGKKATDGTFAINVGLKLNAKLRGTNFASDVPIKQLIGTDAIVFGADIGHGAVGSTGKPGIASVVCTTDTTCMQYEWAVRANPLKPPPAGNVRVPPRKDEIIVEMAGMVGELLSRVIALNNACPPPQIVFFRDGVSESEYDRALREEAPAIMKGVEQVKHLVATDSLKVDDKLVNVSAQAKAAIAKWAPALTYMICGKRHHIRLSDQGRNVPAGTTLDTDITDPYLFDHLTVHHAGRLGTSRGAHYVVLADGRSTPLNANQVQTLCHRFASLYARCNLVVSLVAPVRYADLLAYRAKMWVKHIDDRSTTASVTSGGGGPSSSLERDQSDYAARLDEVCRALRPLRSRPGAPGGPVAASLFFL